MSQNAPQIFPSQNYVATSSANVACTLNCDNNRHKCTDVACFDSDSTESVIDTGTSACFSGDRSTLTNLKPYKGKVKGLGTMTIQGIGMLDREITKDAGMK
eukprot:14461619-Ditylum_brightwellii.AAC.1